AGETTGGPGEEGTAAIPAGTGDTGPGEGGTISPGPILSLRVPHRVSLPPEDAVDLVIGIKNTSPYEAEDLSIGLAGLPPGIRSEPLTVTSLPPGEEIAVHLPLASSAATAGRYPTEVRVRYTFCIDDDACFKFSQSAAFLLVVASGGAGDVAKGSGFPWWLVLGAGALAVLALVLFLGK
ncbi:MAG: hypothetical protein GXO72_00375, partial [Caldiserica bacterium]|nr:hypothetical protein [Caldisericota bacterium]